MQNCSTSKALPSVTSTNCSGLGFGCMSITAFYGDPIPDEDAIALLKAVYDSGCRHFDTAEVYKTGNPFQHCSSDEYNETILGSFLRTVPRESFTVATKYLPLIHDNKCDYDTVKQFLTDSLARLGLDYADIYYSHRVPSLPAAVEFARTAQKLIAEGRIKSYGYSEICPRWLRVCHAVTPVAAIQQEWSVMTRNIEEELVPTCAALGIAVVAYAPLSRSILCGTGGIGSGSGGVTETKERGAPLGDDPPDDCRASLPRFRRGVLLKNRMIVRDIVDNIAEKYDCVSSQVALAWLFAKARELGVTVVPIPGTSKVEHALTNIGSVKIDLGESDVQILDTVSGKIVGLRGDETYISWGFEAQE
eukprot:CAMPEP_0172482238 /NCGR_PEP_ID=MMETSP1066-20121228/8507_1 /TAXON_ID=671091 /ORGANISM="Coscinodiscus wailesii, Strain CCMP2513" /LENGTH=361 /DNA_ID=CAMNT_0013245195 /DNA_START=114 /DNA_END=1199 /DNA_ORIENTATION=-